MSIFNKKTIARILVALFFFNFVPAIALDVSGKDKSEETVLLPDNPYDDDSEREYSSPMSFCEKLAELATTSPSDFISGLALWIVFGNREPDL